MKNGKTIFYYLWEDMPRGRLGEDAAIGLSGKGRRTASSIARKKKIGKGPVMVSGKNISVNLDAGEMACRPGCGACCIAPSISSFIPGMPNGKPAGVRCIQLDQENRCRLFGNPERPAVCGSLKVSEDMCGADREHALFYLALLERATTA